MKFWGNKKEENNESRRDYSIIGNNENSLVIGDQNDSNMFILTYSQTHTELRSIIIEMFKNFFDQNKEFSNPEAFITRTLLVAVASTVNKKHTSESILNPSLNVTIGFINENKFIYLNEGTNKILRIKDKKFDILSNGSGKPLENNILDLQLSVYDESILNNDILIAYPSKLNEYLSDKDIFKIVKNAKNKNDIGVFLKEVMEIKQIDKNLSVITYVH